MTQEEHEQIWQAGYEAAWRRVLLEACRAIGPPDMVEEVWRAERSATIDRLREICKEFGDDKWPNTLYLPDILEKHLWRHLKMNQIVKP